MPANSPASGTAGANRRIEAAAGRGAGKATTDKLAEEYANAIDQTISTIKEK